MEELKILVIRFSSIGDIVLTSPVLRLLNSSKKYEVHFLTKNEYYSLLSENPNIHKIHLLKDSIKNIFFDLKKENFDFIKKNLDSLNMNSHKIENMNKHQQL